MLCTNTRSTGAMALAIFLGMGFLCPSLVRAGQVKQDVNLFPRDPLPEGTNILVPYHTTRSLQRRGQSYIDGSELGLNLPALGEPVHLLYGEDIYKMPAGHVPMIANLTFIPPKNRAILVLEGFILGGDDTPQNAILRDVECNNNLDGIDLSMLGGREVKQKAFTEWALNTISVGELFVVTTDLMRGCGTNERKAFKVNEMMLSDSMTSLNVTHIQWESVAAKVSVEFGQVKHDELRRRTVHPARAANPVPRVHHSTPTVNAAASKTTDTDGSETEVIVPIAFTFGDKTQVFPVDFDEIDIGLPFKLPEFVTEKLEKLPNKLPDSIQIPDLVVNCLKCGVTGEVKLHGKIDVDLFPEKKLDHGFIELTLTKDLVARVELEIVASGSFIYNFEKSLLGVSGLTEGLKMTAFGIPFVLSLDIVFDYSVGVSVELEIPTITATAGAELRIPQGGMLRWDIADKTQSMQKGWDVEVKKIPLNVTDLKDTNSFMLGLNFTSIPSVLVALQVAGGLGAKAGGKLGMFLPRIYAKASLVVESNDNCETAGPTDYQSFPAALALEQGRHFAILGELFATVGIPELNLNASKSVEQVLWEKTIPDNQLCVLFGDKATGKGTFRPADLAKNEKVLNVTKVTAAWEKTKTIPEGVDMELLKAAENQLPEEMKKVLNGEHTDKQKGENNGGISIFNGDISSSAWVMALVAFVPGFF